MKTQEPCFKCQNNTKSRSVKWELLEDFKPVAAVSISTRSGKLIDSQTIFFGLAFWKRGLKWRNFKNISKFWRTQGQFLIQGFITYLHTIWVIARLSCLTLKDPSISESCIEIKIELNFYFHTFIFSFMKAFKAFKSEFVRIWFGKFKLRNTNKTLPISF